MINCANILQGAGEHAEALVSACLQAEATIHAARIEATAARQAGTMGLVAGLVAGVGALLAAGVAYWTFRKQLLVAEDQALNRALAYRHYLVGMAWRAQKDVRHFQMLSGQEIAGWDLIYGLVQNSVLRKLWIEVSPENWERHSLLGGLGRQAVLHIWVSSSQFFQSVEKQNEFHADYELNNDRAGQSDTDSPEQLRARGHVNHAAKGFANSAVHIFNLAAALLKALEAFQECLEADGSTSQNTTPAGSGRGSPPSGAAEGQTP